MSLMEITAVTFSWLCSRRNTKTKSKIINHVVWGKKKLAYTIQGHNYGTYIMVHYNGGDKEALDELCTEIKGS